MDKKEKIRNVLQILKDAGLSTIDDLMVLVELIPEGESSTTSKEEEDLLLEEKVKKILQQKGITDHYKKEEEVPLEVKVKNILHRLGTPAHIKGYQYLTDAIMMAVEDEDIVNAITKILYPSVAERHGTTGSRVERAIRHAIEVTWDRGDIDELEQMFGNTISANKGKPTNLEMIALISDNVRMEMKRRSNI